MVADRPFIGVNGSARSIPAGQPRRAADAVDLAARKRDQPSTLEQRKFERR
jgi:hypothetical protein